ncbi:MAG TPA: hypothetical protein VM537_28600 [Anaerolineae bacterium]|nr:hypothetical protein [Anaerolineae bacterium]
MEGTFVGSGSAIESTTSDLFEITAPARNPTGTAMIANVWDSEYTRYVNELPGQRAEANASSRSKWSPPGNRRIRHWLKW